MLFILQEVYALSFSSFFLILFVNIHMFIIQCYFHNDIFVQVYHVL